MSCPIPPNLMTPDKSNPIPPKNETKETPDGSRKSMGSMKSVHSISSFLKKGKRSKNSSTDCPLGMGEILVTTEVTVTSEPNPYYFAGQERETGYQDKFDSKDSLVPTDPSTSRTWSITGGPNVGPIPDRSQWVTSNGPGPSDGESSATTLSQESTKEWGLYEDTNGDLSNLSIYNVFHPLPPPPPPKNCPEKPSKNNDEVVPVAEKIEATSSSEPTSRGSDERPGTYAPEIGSSQDMISLGRSQPEVVVKLLTVGEQNKNNHGVQRRNKNESSVYPAVRLPTQDTIPPKRFQPGPMTGLAIVGEHNKNDSSERKTASENGMHAPVRSFNQDTTLSGRSQLGAKTRSAVDDEHYINDYDFGRRNTKEGGLYVPRRGARRESYVYSPSQSAFQTESPYVRRPIQHDTSTAWFPVASNRLNKQADVFKDEPMLTPAAYKNHQNRISTAKSARNNERRNEQRNLDYDSMLVSSSGRIDIPYTEIPFTNGRYRTRTLLAKSAQNDETNSNEESENEQSGVEYRAMFPSLLENTNKPSTHKEYEARPSIGTSVRNDESKNKQSSIEYRSMLTSLSGRTKETSAFEEYQTGTSTELESLLNDIKKKPPFKKYQAVKSTRHNESKNEQNYNEDALKNDDKDASKNNDEHSLMLTLSSGDIKQTNTSAGHQTSTRNDEQGDGRAPSRNINQRTFVSRSSIPKPIAKSSLSTQVNNSQLTTPPMSYSRVPSPIVDTSRTSSSAGRPTLRNSPSVDASRPGSSIGRSVLRKSPSIDVSRPGTSIGRPFLRKSPSIDAFRPDSSAGRPALRKSPSIDASRLDSAIGRPASRNVRGNDRQEKTNRPKLTSSLYTQPVLEDYQFSTSTIRSALKSEPKGVQQTDIRDFIERTPPLRYSQNKSTPPLRYSETQAMPPLRCSENKATPPPRYSEKTTPPLRYSETRPTPPLSYAETRANPPLRYSKNKLTPPVGYGRYMPASKAKRGGENRNDKDKDKDRDRDRDRDKDGLGINLDGSSDYQSHTHTALSANNIDPEVELRKELHQLLNRSVSLPWNMGKRKSSDSSSHARAGPTVAHRKEDAATMADGEAKASASTSTSTSTFSFPLGADGIIDNDLLLTQLLTEQYRENAKSAARAANHLNSIARRSLSTATTPQPTSLTVPPIDSPSQSLSQRRRVPPEIPHHTKPVYIRAGFGESSSIQTLSVDGGATKVVLESYTIPNSPRGVRLPPGSPVPLVGSGYGHIIYSYPARASPKPSQEKARRANEIPRLDSVLYFSALERETIAKLVEAASSCKPCDGGHENCTDCLNLKYSILETQIMPTTMAPEERQKVIQNNRSLRTIKTELENLLGNGAVDDATFETIMAALPNESSPNATSGAGSASRPSTTSPAPTAALGNLSLNNAAPPPVSTPSLPSRAPSVPEAPRELSRATAIYRYVAQDAGDCQFNAGDEIAVFEYTNGDWWKGKNLSTGQEGLFPVNYVQPREQPPSYGGYNNDKAPAYNGYGGGYPGQYQQGPPPPGPSNPYSAAVPPMAMAQQPADPGKPSTLKKFGGKLGNAAIFGAGATLGSDMVNAIL